MTDEDFDAQLSALLDEESGGTDDKQE